MGFDFIRSLLSLHRRSNLQLIGAETKMSKVSGIGEQNRGDHSLIKVIYTYTRCFTTIDNVSDVFMQTIRYYEQRSLVFSRKIAKYEQIWTKYAYLGAMEHVVEIC